MPLTDVRKASSQLPERVPVLPIRSTVVFPSGATALQIGFAPNVEALNAHPEPELIIAIAALRAPDLEDLPRGEQGRGRGQGIGDLGQQRAGAQHRSGAGRRLGVGRGEAQAWAGSSSR